MVWLAAIVIISGGIAGAYLFGTSRGPVLGSPENSSRIAAKPAGARRTSITCIVPARNEAQRIGHLLTSLRQQSLEPSDIIVVDDGSTDATTLVAERYGVSVLSPSAPPAGWTGKSWACFQGARAAETDSLLVFIDADVRMEPDALSRLLKQVQPGQILSVQPYHHAPTLIEKLSALFNLQVASAVGLGKGRRASAGLFGPVIAVYAGDYFDFGGHESVAASILEDVELGRVARSHGLEIRNYLGGTAVRYRMYPEGLGALIDGWTKNFLAGARATPLSVLLLESAWITGAVSVSVQLFVALLHTGSTVAAAASFAAYAAYAAIIAYALPVHGSFGALTAALFPVHLIVYGCVFVRALLFRFAGKRIYWRGRELVSSSRASSAGGLPEERAGSAGIHAGSAANSPGHSVGHTGTPPSDGGRHA